MGWLACGGAVVLLVAAMVIGSVPADASPPAARITAAAVRLSVVPGRPAAGYFTLTAGAAPVELTAVTTPLARVELHAMSMAGGVMRMDKLPSVRVAAGQAVLFMPGGSHLMLFDVGAGVHPGTTLPLTFRFADGSATTVNAAVESGIGETMSMPHGAH
jgi:copper(I)-binding protein